MAETLRDWELAATEPGTAEVPDGLPQGLVWVPAALPGTVAGALRDAGRPSSPQDLDRQDWWFRCSVAGRPGPQLVCFGGLATVADVWVNGAHVLRSSNMFRSWRVTVELPREHNDVHIRCAALLPHLAQRRPRPRWKTYLLAHQNLRWVRTSLLGRVIGWAEVPPAVGPWRPVTLRGLGDGVPCDTVLRASVTSQGGEVEAAFTLPGVARVGAAHLRVGGEVGSLDVEPGAGGVKVSGRLCIPEVERWWPHTHGPQPRYEVTAEIDGTSHVLGSVGFRTVDVDRLDGDFRVLVNGEPVFCRGACWMPVDPVALSSSADAVDRCLDLMRRANVNMLRVPGTTFYQDRHFFERCDELGIMVWHDCMFAFCDPPDDERFTDEVVAEVAEAFGVMSGHPCVTVVCGNQEVEEIAAMNGLDPKATPLPLFTDVIPELAWRHLPDVPYVESNPTGGDLPFRMNAGVSQYFGVGGYLRPPEDARRSDVRFAAECLCFATPPEPDTVEESCGGATRAGHDPEWKRGLHHDAGRSWDMEDVRDHYVRSLFGVDPLEVRYTEPERALELGRATNARLMEMVMSEWRRPGSRCGGGLVLAQADLRPGAGWGLVDALGRPKATWYVLRRVWRPVALLLVDEGLNGLGMHVVNDRPQPFGGRLTVAMIAGDQEVERGECEVTVGPRQAVSLEAESLLGGFRDVSYAYRFTPPAYDAVAVTLVEHEGESVAREVFLPGGQRRCVESTVGLRATTVPTDDAKVWTLELSTDRLAQWVTVRVPDFDVEDSWFHMAPGEVRSLTLASRGPAAPRGVVAALNSRRPAPIVQAPPAAGRTPAQPPT
jgi:beta-mannosidase